MNKAELAHRHVSTHAVVRYLERAVGLDIGPAGQMTSAAALVYLDAVHGIDVLAVRLKVFSLVEDALKAGAASVHKDGVTYMVVDGCVVTVVPHTRRSRKGIVPSRGGAAARAQWVAEAPDRKWANIRKREKRR